MFRPRVCYQTAFCLSIMLKVYKRNRAAKQEAWPPSALIDQSGTRTENHTIPFLSALPLGGAPDT